MTDLANKVRRMVEPLRARIAGMVGRGTIKGSDDDRRVQELQIAALAGELLDKVERFQEYGFSSRPLDGAEAVIVSVVGGRGNAIAVATDDRRHRPTSLAKGEVELYTDEGDRIRFSRGREIEVVAGTEIRLEVGSSSIVIDSSGVTITGAAINLDSA